MNSTFIELIKTLLRKEYINKSSQTVSLLNELKSDILKCFYIVAVIGEFNRGKSTFINALLGKSILPTDILPETATVTAIVFNDEPKLSIMTNSGEYDGEASIEFLKKFSAQILDEKSLSQIKYIKIGYPVELLRERVVLVDTPGVADLNEQNAAVTYNFIPKADTVIFILDANSPLKKSERDFINNHLISRGITDILFLLNKYDNIDIEEEPDLIDNVKRRLEKAFVTNGHNTLKNIECLPVSSRNAILGIEANDNKLIESSGINEVKAKLMELLSKSRMKELKDRSYKNRLNRILQSISIQLRNLHAIKLADSESLHTIIDDLTNMLAQKSRDGVRIEKYAEDTKVAISFMSEKSVDFFHSELKEKICDSIENYNQDDFKEFIEKTVSKSIKKNFESWISNYSPAIERLLTTFEQEIARGISRSFNQNIRLASNKRAYMERENFSIVLNAEDISNVNVKAGAIAATGSMGLMAILGGGIVPLIGFAALPFLRRKILTTSLRKAKAEVMPQVESCLSELCFQLKNLLNHHIEERCEVVVKNAKFAYEQLLTDLRISIQSEIDAKKRNNIALQSEAEEFQRALEEIRSIQDTLNKE